MRTIDRLAQTVAFSSTIAILLFSLTDPAVLGFTLLTQLLIGFWQYVAGIAWLLAHPRVKSRQIHLVVSTIYLIVLFAGIEYSSLLGGPWKDFLYSVYLFVLPWILALYYYAITWRSVFPKRGKQSKFLPHTSF